MLLPPDCALIARNDRLGRWLSPASLRQAEQRRRVDFRHAIQLAVGESLCRKRTRGTARIRRRATACVFWPRSLDRMHDAGPTARIASANRWTRSAASRDRSDWPANSMNAPSRAASCICGIVIWIGGFIACVITICCTPWRRASRTSMSPSSADTCPVASTSPCFAMTAMTSFVVWSSAPSLDESDERTILLSRTAPGFPRRTSTSTRTDRGLRGSASCARPPLRSCRRPEG